MITKIELTNFKSHAHTVIEPGRVTALVGPNGCGKTSILQAINYLCLLAEKSAENIFAALPDPTILVRSGQKYLQITGTGLQEKKEWEESIGGNILGGSNHQLGPINSWKRGHEAGTRTNTVGGNVVNYTGPTVNEILNPATYVKTAFGNLSKPSYSPEIPPLLTPDGNGLATVIAYLKTSEEEKHQYIENSLRSIVPIVTKIRVRPAKIMLDSRKFVSINETRVPYDEKQEVVGHELIFDTTSGNTIPAYAMSDGTLLALSLLAASINSTSNSPILLDDIEAGLHPLAQRQLMQVLKDFAEKHDRQIILTSHSPYIVDALDAKDVWVMATDKEGISHSKRLSDHPDAKRAIDILTTGELWDAEGESWVLEDTPAETVNA